VDHRCPFGPWRSSRPSFAYVIWLVSRVINVDTKITEELEAKVVEIADKRVPRPYRFLFLAPPAGQLGPHPGGRFGQARRAALQGLSDHPAYPFTAAFVGACTVIEGRASGGVFLARVLQR